MNIQTKLALVILAVALPSCAAPPRPEPPKLPVAPVAVTQLDLRRSAALARSVKTVVQPPCTNCPRCYYVTNFYDPVPPLQGHYFSSFWDQLQFNWSYDFQTASSPTGPWTTVASGIWAYNGTEPAYYGLTINNDGTVKFERAIGTPIALVLAMNAPVGPPLRVRFKNQPFKH